MVDRLPLPRFSVHRDTATEWPKWREHFELCMKSLDNANKSGQVKVAALLEALGREAAEIFDRFDWGERTHDRDDLDAVLSKFTERFVPLRSETYGRFLFRQRRQKTKENFDSFYKDLLELARSCYYPDAEKPRTIRDQIVFGVRSDRLRQKLLAEPMLTLALAVDICRTQEADGCSASRSVPAAARPAETVRRAAASPYHGVATHYPADGGRRRPLGNDTANHAHRQRARQGGDDNGGDCATGDREFSERACFPAKMQRVAADESENVPPVAAATAGKENIVISHLGPDDSVITLVLANLQPTDGTRRSCQVLILTPTRELALRTEDALEKAGQHQRLTCHVSVGGTNVRQDAAELTRRGFDVVVGTPGRIMDLLKRRAVDTRRLRSVIIDEADELLRTQEFSKQLSDIIEQLPTDVRVALVSAASSLGVRHFASTFTRNAIEVYVKNEQEAAPEGIRQFYTFAKHDKYSAFIDLYRTIPDASQVVIFCNAKKTVDWLAEQMNNDGFAVSRVHGQKGHTDQAERNAVLHQFRHGKCRTLIATDGLSFGVDASLVSMVINYDLPVRRESYLNRISCRRRHGRKGVVVNFVAPYDKEGLRDLKDFCSAKLEEMPSNIADYL